MVFTASQRNCKILRFDGLTFVASLYLSLRCASIYSTANPPATVAKLKLTIGLLVVNIITHANIYWKHERYNAQMK